MAKKKEPNSKVTDLSKSAKTAIEQFPHFRTHKPSNHPALIVAEHSIEEYDYRKATHSEREGRHLNEKISPNPNPKDLRPMYLVKRIRHDKKSNFSKKKLPWKFPKK